MTLVVKGYISDVEPESWTEAPQASVIRSRMPGRLPPGSPPTMSRCTGSFRRSMFICSATPIRCWQYEGVPLKIVEPMCCMSSRWRSDGMMPTGKTAQPIFSSPCSTPQPPKKSENGKPICAMSEGRAPIAHIVSATRSAERSQSVRDTQ